MSIKIYIFQPQNPTPTTRTDDQTHQTQPIIDFSTSSIWVPQKSPPQPPSHPSRMDPQEPPSTSTDLNPEPNDPNHQNPIFPTDPNFSSSDFDRNPPRFPRWTRQEIVVLIEAKRVEESKGRRYRVFDAGVNGSSNSNPESKWSSISNYCKRHGVNREPVQCRKRWSTISRDYKRIKEWELLNKDQSFWVLRNDMRRERKLPGFFDRELYNILERAFGGKKEEFTSVVKEEEAVFDSGRTAGEDGLFSDVEHSVQEEIPESPEKEMIESPSVTPPPGVQSEKLPELTPEKVSASKTAGQKRPRVSSEEDSSNIREHMISILERNGRILNSHIEAHNRNCQLDRNQRTEQAESLIGVLGKLADALGRIADKFS